ncbi:DUF1905 domain-containing protein [Alteraurantiacibacter aestuarii]|uniref:DUF1905 domain-containing protein n=1 Tax=Alteraurantiacibacter aestuarii TaxID=650004 RepID=A0A844ZII4_9SPHN|nr:DUF1905 domain-containing protein [Alteraurantiacibacter aestuarii]MXO87598.1 DUF1905 domain-containing protein [Alteraurantiacibacter aestuarii]
MQSGDQITVSGTLLGWRNDSGVLATYIRIEGKAAEEISGHELLRRIESGKRRGFGSVKVEVKLGDSEWSTSVFPQDYGWFLPIKAVARRAQGVAEGDEITAQLTLL